MNKQNIINVLIVISIVIAATLIIWYIFGNSPTVDQIIAGLVVAVYPFMLGIYERLNRRVIQTNDKISESKESVLKEVGDLKLMMGQLQGKLSKRGNP